MRPLWLLLLASASAWGCSCINSATPCSVLGGEDAIFVALVTADSGEGIGAGPARVTIEERLQNVPAELAETTIETSAGTSCYYRLKAGDRYVIISKGPKYAVAGCSLSFPLRGNEHVLSALREQLRGGPSQVFGTVLKSQGQFVHNDVVADARVSLSGPGGTYTTTSDGSGRCRLLVTNPGAYAVSVTKEGFLPDADFNQFPFILSAGPARSQVRVSSSLQVDAGACRIQNLSMWPLGRITGAVRDGSTGAPLEGVTVQAFSVNESGRRDPNPLRSAISAADGGYVIEPLPPGRFVVAVNGRQYEDDGPYAPTFFDSARPLSLSEGGTQQNVNLQLPVRRTPAQLTLTILGPDGQPQSGAVARLENLSGLPRWTSTDIKSDVRGQLTVPVFLGDQYVLTASYWLIQDRMIRPLEGTTKLDVTSPDLAVTIVLHERSLPAGR